MSGFIELGVQIRSMECRAFEEVHENRYFDCRTLLESVSEFVPYFRRFFTYLHKIQYRNTSLNAFEYFWVS